MRLTTGAIFTGLLITAVAFSGWFLHILFGVITILSLQEFYQLFKKSSVSPDPLLGPIIGGAIYFSLIFDLNITALDYNLIVSGGRYVEGIPADYPMQISDWTIWILVLSFPIVAMVELFRKKKTPFQNIGITLLGLFYIIVPFYLLNLLAVNPETLMITEPWPILALLLIVWSNDTFAYLIGKAWGKTKLFERISPKKTWEGLFGGLVFAQLCAFIIAFIMDDNYVEYSVYALCLTVFGTIGDLIESMLKRSLSVKDSGKILPGHGGLLDRFDALIFTIPVIYLLHSTVFS